MRKLIVLSFVTLDGIMQAPGGPDEDPSAGFKHGGWSVGYFDDFLGKVMTEQMGHPFDLLLGRKTFEIFAAFWPTVKDETGAGINRAKKYVVSHKPVSLDWKTTVPITGDVVGKIKDLKAEDGPELQVHGSGDLIQTPAEERPGRRVLAQDVPGSPRHRKATLRGGHHAGRVEAARQPRVAKRCGRLLLRACGNRQVGVVWAVALGRSGHSEFDDHRRDAT
jgi:dihydrofolate reductase